MVSYAVFAQTPDNELFLGHTTSTSDDPRTLLSAVVGRMAPARLAIFSRIQRTEPPVVVARRTISGDDPWADLLANNRYLQDGQPFLAAR